VDRRWVRCRRPMVMVGGELTLESLELSYNPTAGFYKAPVQAIANGGVLVIDDFGRQRVAARDLLNRWIVPLESRVDFLTLNSGQKFELPFMTLVAFATNIRPQELVDEAFLRRIHYKVLCESPSYEDFILIFRKYCDSVDVSFERPLVEELLDGVGDADADGGDVLELDPAWIGVYLELVRRVRTDREFRRRIEERQEAVVPVNRARIEEAPERLPIAEALRRVTNVPTVALPSDLLGPETPPATLSPSRALALAVARAPGAALSRLEGIYSRPSAAEEKHGAS